MVKQHVATMLAYCLKVQKSDHYSINLRQLLSHLLKNDKIYIMSPSRSNISYFNSWHFFFLNSSKP